LVIWDFKIIHTRAKDLIKHKIQIKIHYLNLFLYVKKLNWWMGWDSYYCFDFLLPFTFVLTFRSGRQDLHDSSYCATKNMQFLWSLSDMYHIWEHLLQSGVTLFPCRLHLIFCMFLSTLKWMFYMSRHWIWKLKVGKGHVTKVLMKKLYIRYFMSLFS
jgi:hypothetical protein